MKTKTFCSMTARGLVAAAVAFAPFAGAIPTYNYRNATCNHNKQTIKREGLKKVYPDVLLTAYHCTKDITYLKSLINRTDIEEDDEVWKYFAKAHLASDYLDEIYKKNETNKEEFTLERENFEQLIEIYKLYSDVLNFMIKENPSYPAHPSHPASKENAYYELDLRVFPETLSDFQHTEHWIFYYISERRNAKLPPFRALEKEFLNLKSENEEFKKAIKNNNILENIRGQISKKFDGREKLINNYKEVTKNVISDFNKWQDLTDNISDFNERQDLTDNMIGEEAAVADGGEEPDNENSQWTGRKLSEISDQELLEYCGQFRVPESPCECCFRVDCGDCQDGPLALAEKADNQAGGNDSAEYESGESSQNGQGEEFAENGEYVGENGNTTQADSAAESGEYIGEEEEIQLVGSIAYYEDSETWAYGVAWNWDYDEVYDAKQSALQECKSLDKRCKKTDDFTDCISIVDDNDEIWFSAGQETKGEARNIAISYCKEGSDAPQNCKENFSVCNGEDEPTNEKSGGIKLGVQRRDKRNTLIEYWQ